ncbi:hypothetical protein [Sphingomicrobium aestuariivivum]|uniref:hypothetical protein n=1 Tax=Sphingomicrobium aestuariivivum TaxID=1582356 RepID=UPI001FD6575E|nr:hypothetical protein [Sphingomicrobium aestuariivivum]MCJ8190286.1 hypothetical protein [Sphingomicrobium aestuariivivum]
MRPLTLAAAVLTAMTATPALAQPGGYGTPDTAFEEMMAGDYDAAETKLLESARTDVGARINLAQIFATSGREPQAAVLLRSVMQNDDIPLEGVDGRILSSHDVAETLLGRMGATEMLASNGR